LLKHLLPRLPLPRQRALRLAGLLLERLRARLRLHDHRLPLLRLAFALKRLHARALVLQAALLLACRCQRGGDALLGLFLLLLDKPVACTAVVGGSASAARTVNGGKRTLSAFALLHFAAHPRRLLCERVVRVVPRSLLRAPCCVRISCDLPPPKTRVSHHARTGAAATRKTHRRSRSRSAATRACSALSRSLPRFVSSRRHNYLLKNARTAARRAASAALLLLLLIAAAAAAGMATAAAMAAGAATLVSKSR